MLKRRKGFALVLAAVICFSIILPGMSLAGSRPANADSTGDVKAQGEGKFFADQVILKLKGNARQQNEFLFKNKLTVLRRDSRFNYIWAKTPKGSNVETITRSLKKDPTVVSVQPNHIYRTFGKTNDPLYSRQWSLQKINAEKAWNVSSGKQGVIIAILDTGVDVNHPDLRGQLVPGTNTVNPLKSVRDDDGHGTHVAGISAAAANNGTGIAGIAGNCKIMPVKVFDYWGGSDISVADGIIWAADHGAKVINMSFGTWSGSSLLGEAIEYANSKGVIMVAAAGNWASQNISYPAALSQVIAVSATDKNDKLARFSSFGPEIDVSAPGERIFSTFWDQHKGSTYCDMDGTSMAAPQVAGLAALLISAKPWLSGEEVRQIIESSAVDLGEPGWDPQYGHGRIDIFKALTTSFDRMDVQNNTQEGAVSLKSGDRVTQKLDYGFDEDWYTVPVPDKGSLQIELQPAGKVSPALEVYNESGERLEAFNVMETDFLTNPLDYWGMFSQQVSVKVGEAVYGVVGSLDQGNYYIKVFGNHNRWSDAHYSLTASVLSQDDILQDTWEENDVLKEARKIDLGKAIQGTVNPSSDEDWYKVYLMPDRIYKIDLQVPDTLDLAVEVYPEPIEEGGDGNGDGEENLDSWDYWDLNYSLETIDYAGQGGNESGTFKVYSETPGYYYLKVYDTAKGAANSLYTLSIKDFVPPKDAFEPNDNEKSAAAIDLGKEIKAGFSSENDEDWFTFRVDNTGILELTWQGTEVLKPELFLYDEEMNLVGYRDLWSSNAALEGSASPRHLQYKVSSGKYYLCIANSWGAVTGEYSFSAAFKNFNFVDREINDSYGQAVPTLLGTTANGTIYPANDVDYYALEVEEKGPVLVRLTPPKGMDSAMAVYMEPEPANSGEDKSESSGKSGQDPYMDFITEINSGSYSQPDIGVFMASKPGTYYLVVTGWPEFEGDNIKGSYSLSVSKFNSKPDWWENNNTLQKARAIGNNAIFKPTFMGTEDKDWYKIYIPSNTKLSVRLEVPNDIDGVLELYDSAGRLLRKADQALRGEEEGVSLDIRKSGVYYIKTYDYLGNASVLPYKLSVNYTRNAVKKGK